MRNQVTVLIAAAVLVCLVPVASQAQLAAYSQDFEGLIQTDLTALGDDGWLVYGNVYAPDLSYMYGYGPFPAPNDGFGFCQIVLLEGGLDQGIQQLVVFSDYNNVDHVNSNLIESNTYREWVVGPGDVGYIWTFEFDAKLGNLAGASTAAAFIKTLDSANGWALTNFITEDMTAIPATWETYSLSITIDSSLNGQILQVGFANTATDYVSSGVFYDNVTFTQTGDVSSVPDGSIALGAKLHQNYPNPFNPSTRIGFVLDKTENVDISVFDLAGRRVVTLQHGPLGAGEHHVTWNGRTDRGSPAATGHYRYVMTTATTRVSRGMVLLK